MNIIKKAFTLIKNLFIESEEEKFNTSIKLFENLDPNQQFIEIQKIRWDNKELADKLFEHFRLVDINDTHTIKLKDGKAVLIEDDKEFKIPELTIEHINTGQVQKDCNIIYDYNNPCPLVVSSNSTGISCFNNCTVLNKKQKRPYILTKHSKLRTNIIHPGDLVYNYAIINKKKLRHIAKEIGISGWTIQKLVRHEYHLHTNHSLEVFSLLGFSPDRLRRLQKNFDKKAKKAQK